MNNHCILFLAWTKVSCWLSNKEFWIILWIFFFGGLKSFVFPVNVATVGSAENPRVRIPWDWILSAFITRGEGSWPKPTVVVSPTGVRRLDSSVVPRSATRSPVAVAKRSHPLKRIIPLPIKSVALLRLLRNRDLATLADQSPTGTGQHWDRIEESQAKRWNAIVIGYSLSSSAGSDGGVFFAEDLRILCGVRDRAGDRHPGGEQGVPGNGGHVHAFPPRPVPSSQPVSLSSPSAAAANRKFTPTLSSR